MSKVARAVGAVAAVVALSLAIPGVGTAIGLSAAGTATAAAVASAVATSAGAIAAATAKQRRPGAIGAINSVIIGANMALPYAVGRTFVAGSQVYEDSGGTSPKGIQNFTRFSVRVITAAGPVDSFESFLSDFSPVGFSSGAVEGNAAGYYANFLYNQVRYGTWPESAHDYSPVAMPNWGANYQLSGYASYRVAMIFDKEGEHYSGGVPQFGLVGKWVKAYDPRKDSTYPGGSGSHRWDDETSWEWTENPALHALTYARGRFIERNANGTAKVPPLKILGPGFSKDSIIIADFVEGANIADANGWKCGGTIYDGPEISRWDNIKRFCEAFGAKPSLTGGRLGLKLFAPRPSLFTLTADDVIGNVELRAMKPYQDRFNTVAYRYRSEIHRWEHVQGDPIAVASYLDEDGEPRTKEMFWELVQDKNQAAQLAVAGLIVDRQFGPLTLACKPRLSRFRPGEAGTVHLPDAGLVNRKMVITGRQIDPSTGAVTLTMESEPSDAEYTYALTRSGSAPPTPVIRLPQEVDQAVSDFRPGSLTDEQIEQIAALQGLVDGDLQFFYSPSEPGAGSGTTFTNLLFENGVDLLAFENGIDLLAFETVGSVGPTGPAEEGDIWYNPDTQEWRQLEGEAWVVKTGYGVVGQALINAASLQGLADGKASIFYTDVEPNPTGVGDLWIKQSGAGRTVKTWNGTTWELMSEVGADITSYIVPGVDGAVKIAADYTGTIKAGEMPRALSYKLVRNGVTVTSGVSWSYQVLTGSINGVTDADPVQPIASTGAATIEVNAVGATGGKIRVSAALGGSVRVFEQVVSVVADAPPTGGGGSTGGGGGGSTGGGSSTISSFTPSNAASNTYGSSDNVLPNVVTGTAGTITFTAPLNFYLVGSSLGTVSAYGVWQYRAIGGTWTDVAAEVAADYPSRRWEEVDGFPYTDFGSLVVNQTKIGLSANTEYEVRLRLRDTSTARSVTFSGSAGATGS